MAASTSWRPCFRAGSPGPTCRGDAFYATVFGMDGAQTLAAHAQEVGLALADMPAEGGMAVAGRRFAALVKAAHPQPMGRVMAGPVTQAATPAARNLVQQAAARRSAGARHGGPHQAHPTEHPAHAVARPHTTEASKRAAQEHKREVDDLARVIHNEARGQGRTAMAAVGWTLRNRMLRNGVDKVEKAWAGYNHGPMNLHGRDDRAALPIATEVAEGILDGAIHDPTGGATHYYSPQSMPNENDRRPSGDVSGGLESVDGVIDRDTGNAVRNYRPGYSLTFPPRSVPGIVDRDYKFYRQPDGAGRVH